MSFVQNYSVSKVLGLEAIVGTCAVVPLVPHFSDGLVYTAFWYSPPFFPFLVACCVISGILFLVSLPMLWRALFRLPAIVISDGRLTIYSNWRKSAAIEEITDVQAQFGNALIKRAVGRSFTAPVALCKQPTLTLEHLQSLVGSNQQA